MATMPVLSSLPRLLLSTSSLSALEAQLQVKNLLLAAALDVGGAGQDEAIAPSDDQSSIVEEDLPAGPAGADLFATSRASSAISLGEGSTSAALLAQEENEEGEVLADQAAIQLNDLKNNELDSLTVEDNLEELLYAEQEGDEGDPDPVPHEEDFFSSGSSTSSSVIARKKCYSYTLCCRPSKTDKLCHAGYAWQPRFIYIGVFPYAFCIASFLSHADRFVLLN